MKKRNFSNRELRDIQIAKIAFIGATITTIGDGITAYATALALDALENPIEETRASIDNNTIDDSRAQIDYYINELIQIRNGM